MKFRSAAPSLIFLAIIVFPLVAFGVDYWQGPVNNYWHRTDPGATYQAWEFETDDTGNDFVFADYYNNPYGVPTAAVPDDTANDNFWYWETVDCPVPSQQGPCHALRASSAAGYKSITFTIANSPFQNSPKWIQIQSTDTAVMADSVKVFVENNEGEQVRAALHFIDREVKDWEGDDHFLTIATVYALDFNPDLEFIEVSWPADTLVEEVVIDTICWGGTNPPVDNENKSWGSIKSLFR